MATTPATWSREALAAAPQSYIDAVDAMDVDAVFPRNGSHVSALKKQPDGLAVPVRGTRVFLDCSVEDRLTCNRSGRRGLTGARRGLDSWSCHQNGKNHCYKCTHRAHRPSSCRGYSSGAIDQFFGS